jgi:hypothetical protein
MALVSLPRSGLANSSNFLAQGDKDFRYAASAASLGLLAGDFLRVALVFVVAALMARIS